MDSNQCREDSVPVLKDNHNILNVLIVVQTFENGLM